MMIVIIPHQRACRSLKWLVRNILSLVDLSMCRERTGGLSVGPLWLDLNNPQPTGTLMGLQILIQRQVRADHLRARCS